MSRVERAAESQAQAWLVKLIARKLEEESSHSTAEEDEGMESREYNPHVCRGRGDWPRRF